MMFISAFWHGVHPGYYVTFMSVPLMIFSDRQLSVMVKPYLRSERQMYYFEWVRWFLLYRIYEYLSVGFIMLKLDVVWSVFKQNYFIGHIIMVIISILPFILPKKKFKGKEETSKTKFANEDDSRNKDDTEVKDD